MTDADGNTIENENIILSGTKGKQKITVQKAGTYYLTYFIDEDEYNTADHINQYAAISQSGQSPAKLRRVKKSN